MSKSNIILQLFPLAMLVGCAAGNSTPYKKNINNEISILAKKYAAEDSNKYEITQPIEHVFSFLKTEYSENKWLKLSNAYTDTTRNLETHIQNIYGKSLYRIAGGEMQFKDAYPNNSYTVLDTFSINFVKVIAPNRIPEQEKEIIKSQLEQYTKRIIEILAEDSELKLRFEYGLKHMYSKGKIEIVLATNANQAKFEGLRRNYAISKFGYQTSPNDPDSATFSSSIATKYFGMISTSTIMHELVHSVVGIIQASPKHIRIPYHGMKDLQRSIDSLFDASQDMMITEGVAESISQKFNPMYNAGYFNSVDKNIAWQENQYGKMHDIESAGKCYNGRFCSFDGRILALYEANSFVNYLIKMHGYSKIIRLATCTPDDSNYMAILGKGKEQLYDDWKKQYIASRDSEK